MKQVFRLFAMLLCCVGLSVGTSMAWANHFSSNNENEIAGSCQSTENEAKKIRVLFVDGGHDYDEPAFLEMLADFPQLEVSRAHSPDDFSIFAPGLEEKCDVILFYSYDSFPVTQEQKEQFEALLQRGISIYALHHHLGAHPSWSDYYKFIGGWYVIDQNSTIEGEKQPLSTYHYDQTINVHVNNTEHPITRDVKNFTIIDETYNNCYVSPNVELLLSTSHPLSTDQLAWVNRYGNSVIFTNTLGHDAKAFKNPDFRKILIQAIEYLVAVRK